MIALIFFGIIGFLSVKGATNIALFTLLALSLIFVKQSATCFHQARQIKLILLTLSLPVLAIFIGQLGRNIWLIRGFDGPSRIFFSIPILFFFRHKQINFSRIIGLAAPLAIIAVALNTYLHPTIILQESGRLASTFVRPNSYGTYTSVLTGFCLIHLFSSDTSPKLWFLYQSVGMLLGLILVIGSGTRGSWITLPFMFFIWLLFNYKKLHTFTTWIFILAIITYFILSPHIVSFIVLRIIGAYDEIAGWFNHSNVNTSMGIRFSIWRLSWQLFYQHPFFGYGNEGYAAFLNHPWIDPDIPYLAKMTLACCGAHNELLASTLRSGITGMVSVLCLFTAPFFLFTQHVKHHNKDIATAAQLGLTYITCIAICSINIEVLHFKYLSSFYGLIIAGLTAQILSKK